VERLKKLLEMIRKVGEKVLDEAAEEGAVKTGSTRGRREETAPASPPRLHDLLRAPVAQKEADLKINGQTLPEESQTFP